MRKEEVASLVVLKCTHKDELLSTDVFEPNHVNMVIADEVEKLELKFLNSWVENGRENVFAYEDSSNVVYQFRVIIHTIFLED